MAIDSVNQASYGFGALSPIKQLFILIGLACSVALGFYIVLWSQKGDLAPLYATLSTNDASQIIDVLDKGKMEYKYNSSSGAISVPSDKVHEIRMKLAQLGLPKDANSGYELLDEPQSFGTSQFMESVKYKRSLEGELSKTISSIEIIRKARVHLGMAKQTSFIKRNAISSASVFVDLMPGYTLNNAQVMGIVNLVSASIPGLTREHVTLVDQNGTLLNSKSDNIMDAAQDQLNYVKAKESQLSHKIVDLLTPIYGVDNVKAGVTAELDFTYTEKTEENFDPKSVVRSETLLTEQRRDGNSGAEGAPGALSNQPPAISTAPEGGSDNATTKVSPGTEKPTLPSSKREQTARNYEVDKAIVHTKHDTGKIKRLSVAVVINDKISYNNKGEAKSQPLTEDEIRRVENLVKDAIGFDQERGDKLSVINSSFSKAPPIPEPKPLSLLQQPWVIPAVKQALAGGFILLIIFGLIKPIMKNLSEVKVEMPNKSDVEKKFIEESMQLQLPAPDKNSVARIEHAKKVTHDDTKKAAQVVMNWVGKEDD